MNQNVFTTDRPLLFSIAYRMLGSASDAEDVLQDAWMRYRGADETSIRSPKAFATTIVSRLCLDRLKSARAAREEYIGPWLPEPVLTSEVKTPDALLQRAESVTLAFLVLLETLSPEERAVFLLKDIFRIRQHAGVAEMLDHPRFTSASSPCERAACRGKAAHTGTQRQDVRSGTFSPALLVRKRVSEFDGDSGA